MPDKTRENPAAQTDSRDDLEDNQDDTEAVAIEPSGTVANLGLRGRPAARERPALARTTVSPINADRPVFTLSVAADLLGMHPRTLRIYEEEGLVVPARTATKRRRYSQNDIRRFQFIQHLTQRLRVNLAGVRIILEMMNALEGCGVDFTPRLYEMGDQLAGDLTSTNTPL
ncbi:MAG TPA: MerR family transcriptional regulator [Chloroflexia bacterium]|nr:MerR family transcriptional regulator [Chloroflexia bacterium]